MTPSEALRKTYGKITKADSVHMDSVVMRRKRRKEIGDKEVRAYEKALGPNPKESEMTSSGLARYKQAYNDAATDTTRRKAMEDVKRSQVPGGPLNYDVEQSRKAIQGAAIRKKKPKSKY